MTTEERIESLEIEVRNLRRALEVEQTFRCSLARRMSDFRVRFDRLEIQFEVGRQRGGLAVSIPVDKHLATTVPNLRARR